MSLYSSVVHTQEHASSTLFTSSAADSTLTIGLRVLDNLKDATVQAQYALPSQMPWAQGVVSTTAHVGWGLANSTLFDGVLAYAQHLKGGSLLSASLSLGLQAHCSVIPSLDRPLFNLLPYLEMSLAITPKENLVLETSLCTATFFDYSGQCWAPALGFDAAYHFTKGLAVGVNAFVRFSDIHPETVIILSQEVGVYVVLQS